MSNIDIERVEFWLTQETKNKDKQATECKCDNTSCKCMNN